MLERPRSDQPHYGAHLGDHSYWQPYVVAALSRHELPIDDLEAPFVGTFPTYLVGGVVVKLFGPAFDGLSSHDTELAMHQLLAGHPEVPAPTLIASGSLFDDEPRWPYLITERLSGTAIRDADLGVADGEAVAARLGEVTARLHQLSAPPAVSSRDLLPELRATAAERLERFGLPRHLLDEVPDYLADARRPDTLVHADVTADHAFVEGDRLIGIIDWGDALLADPYYELVAIYLDALRGQRRLLERFLDGYGWLRSDEFCRQALQGVLEFEFDAIARVGELVDLLHVASLDELAEQVFA